MNIERLLSHKDVRRQMTAYAHAERYVNNGSPSGEHKTVSKPYSPIDGQTSFELPYRVIGPGNATVLEASPSSSAKDFIYDGSGNLRFFVHPDMTASDYSQNTEHVRVFPTASGRTVCVFERPDPLFIKLHYDGMLGRVSRRMKKNEAAQSIEVSAELDRQRAEGLLPQTFGYMPETLGVVVSVGEKEIGYVVRELTVRGNLKSADVPILIPWFALFSADRKSPNDPTLLEQWIKILGQDSSLKTASNFFRDRFLFPVIESFCYLADRAGLIVDYNAQNLLVVSDGSRNPTTVAMRDMQSTWVDLLKRRENQMPDKPFIRSMDGQTDSDREYLFKQRSLYFDHKFTEYVLLPVIDAFVKSFGGDIETLIEESREYLLAHFPSIGEYFKPYDLSFRQPPGVMKKDMNGRSILAIAPKSPFR